MDQMSLAPRRPDFSFLMTSGAMYIGVPAREFISPSGPSAPIPPPAAFLMRVLAMVRFPLTMTCRVSNVSNSHVV